jgi:hypothetical protein
MFDQGPTDHDTPGGAGAQLGAAVDALARVCLDTAGDETLLGLLRELEVAKHRLAALDAVIVAQVHARGLAGPHACASTAALLMQLLRLHPREAAGRVRAAQELGPRRALTGERLGPVFPAVADALSAGRISARHAGVITRTIDALPEPVAAAQDRAVEQFLVSEAERCNPAQLAVLARRISDTLDPDGTLTDVEQRHRRRYLHLTQRPDGSAHLEAELEPVCAEALLTVLDTLARPNPATTGVDAGSTNGAGIDAEPGSDAGTGSGATVVQRDLRSPGQRRHDGLRDALLTLIRSDQLPECGGISATIVLTLTAADFAAGTGLAQTGHGALIPTTQVRRLVGDAQLLPVLLSRTRRIEAYGHTQRYFTAGQRLAMISRDHGCSFPDCTAPPAWCQAHHVIAWADGGPTSVDNGTLLCGHHHREHSGLGWSCAMINGTPHWSPPSWIDPTRTPRINTAHHTAADLGWAKLTAAADNATNDVLSSSGSDDRQLAPVRRGPDRR